MWHATERHIERERERGKETPLAVAVAVGSRCSRTRSGLVGLRLALGAWRAAANFTVTPRFQLTCWRPLARPINQMSRHRHCRGASGCRMPQLQSLLPLFVDFILIYEDRFIWLPLLLLLLHAAMSKFIAVAR